MQLNLNETNLQTWFSVKENRLYIKKYLPIGYAKEIANKHEYSLSAIYKLMAGAYFKLEISLALVELAVKNEKNRKEVEGKIINLLNNFTYEQNTEHSKGVCTGCLSEP
jgi:hypothetical protein